MFKKFEDLHPSKTAAYADGVLCGIALTIIVGSFVKQIRSDRAQAKLMAETAIDPEHVTLFAVEN